MKQVLRNPACLDAGPVRKMPVHLCPYQDFVILLNVTLKFVFESNYKEHKEDPRACSVSLSHVTYCMYVLAIGFFFSIGFDLVVTVGAGVGKMTWLIDFEGYSYRNAPPVTLAMKTLSILQNHYPERLGLAVCYHPPRLFQITWKVSSFLQLHYQLLVTVRLI